MSGCLNCFSFTTCPSQKIFRPKKYLAFPGMYQGGSLIFYLTNFHFNSIISMSSTFIMVIRRIPSLFDFSPFQICSNIFKISNPKTRLTYPGHAIFHFDPQTQCITKSKKAKSTEGVMHNV